MPGGPLAEAGLSMLAGLYRELNKLGIGPRDVDRLTFWECAVLLGVGSEDEASTVRSVATDSKAMLKARVAAAKAGAPEPRWASGGDGSALMGALAGA